MRRLIIANTYYQIMIALQMRIHSSINDSTVFYISSHSNDARIIANRIKKTDLFEEVHYFETDATINKNSFFNKCGLFFSFCFDLNNRYYGFKKKEKGSIYNELLSFNINKDTLAFYTILSMMNIDLSFSRFEEGILSYNSSVQKIDDPKWKIMDFVRRIQGKPEFSKAGKNFYCFYPELYKGELTPVKVPLISDTPETVEIIKKVFDVNLSEDDYKEKYIFFTSVYDFEGDHPIGEYELVCKIADKVGKDNLLIKTHPRDKRTIYTDNGFKVDRNSNTPWEAIQLSGDFSDKVFLTATSGSVLSGSFLSSKPPKTFYLYKLCHIDGNKIAEESRRNITELLADKTVKNIFGSVKIAESIEDILE